MSVPLHSVHAQPFPYSIQETQVGSSSINVSLKRDPSADQPQRPAKRSRKAINCEPCRQSKLKCDRGKPCSGCVLRGTSAQCYADSPNNYDSTSSCGREDQGPRIDPRAEITRIRNSLLAIEQHINRSSSSSSPSQPASSNYPSRSDSLAPTSLPPISYLSTSISPDYQRHNNTASLDVNADNSPSAFRPENGIYIGPTSTASHLLSLRNGEQRGTTTSDVNGEEQYSAMAEGAPFGKLDDPSPLPVHQVDELLEHLPDTSEELISYYFENCTWLHRNLHQETFLKAWARFNNSASRPGGHIILATAFGILGIAVQYLPPNHTLFETSPDSQNDIANQYHRMAETAYRRHLLDTREPSLEVVEYLLIKAQFLHITKHDLEQVWAVRGELLSIGLAMGLHRDPGKWKMSREVKERRRWAWWNILMTDRWQSFMFGRPIGISNHHFDTKYPMEDNSDLAASATSNPELAYLQNFRLVAVMGDIQDDALCLRPVPYERIEAHDQSIQHLIETLPPDFNQDEIVFARNAYRGLEFKRHAVQSIMCRAALHHVRLTLHRPYTAPRASGDFFLRASEENRMKSFETAVVAADKVIQLVARTGQEYVGHPTLNVPGHLSWGPFHAFGAAMFFTFQLIWRPGQLGAGQFKANIARVLSALELVRANNPYSQKAWSVLSALRPLWDDEGGLMLDDKQKNEIWDNARRLAFPIHTGSSVSDNESRSSPGSGSSPGSDAYMRRASSGTGNSPVEGVTNGTTRNGLNHAWTSSPANSMHSAPTPSVSAVGGSGTGGSLFPVNTGGVLMANNGGTPASVYGSGTVSANITGGTSASGIHPRIEGVNNSSTGTITPPGYSNPSFTSQSTHVQHAIPQHYPSHQHQRSHSQPYIDAFPPGPTEDALWSASLGLYQPGDWSNMIGNVMRPADHRGNNGRGFLG